MKLYLNSRILLLYKGGFTQVEELEAIAKKNKAELHIVEPESLDMSVAAIAGYVDVPLPSMPYDVETEKEPTESCLVFSGIDDTRTNRILDQIKQSSLELGYKAVVTPSNRNWAFGAFMQEMEKEKAEMQAKEEPSANLEEKN